MIKKSVTISIFIIFSLWSFSQTVTLPDNTALKCETIDFPIVAASFPANMGSATIDVGFNPAELTYIGNTPGTISGYLIGYDAVNQRVAISWAADAATNINGTMLTIHFTYLGGNSNLVFLPSCEFTTYFPLDPVFPVYDNGTASPLVNLAYHVDGSVGSSGNGLSWAAPFKTIGEATGLVLRPGDSVLVKDNIYNETVVIRSNGKEVVPVRYNVSVTDTNKITFPVGTDLGCMDLASHAGQFYAYVYRSWKGNNGVYKITQVNTSSRYVIVENAAFIPESGASGDTSLLQASVGQPVFYLKYSTNPETQRVIINATSVPTIKSVCYVGTPLGAGDDVTTPANYNMIDGFDLTANSTSTGISGLKITGSKFNVFRNSRIYELDSIAVLLLGDAATSHPCNYNMILDNKIYNTKSRGLKVGVQGGTTATNTVQFTLFKGNEIFSSGTTSSNINFINAADIHKNTSFTVIEKNVLSSFKLKSAGRGAIEVWDNARKTLVYGNFIKNINKLVTGTNSLIYIRSANNNINVFNNVLLDSIAQNSDIFAFRLTGNNTTSNRVVFNTIYNIDNGILFEDSGAGTNDFKVQDNIIYINYLNGGTYFTHTGTTGRFTVSYNCYPTTPTLTGQPYNIETGRQVGDPSFLNTSFFLSGTGLSLQSGSICINNGTPVTGITRDHFCRVRNATTPSIGAYEAPVTSCAWTGANGQNWQFYKNWDILYVPTQTISVLIPDRFNDPLISSGSASCKSLQVQPGALLKVQPPGSITIYP